MFSWYFNKIIAISFPRLTLQVYSLLCCINECMHFCPVRQLILFYCTVIADATIPALSDSGDAAWQSSSFLRATKFRLMD
jgi:hypothetical protein